MDGADGEVFGRYRLLEALRSGETGTVYRAHDTMMSREVTVKVLPPETAADQERFRREVSIAARFNDPHIMPIYEAGEIDGRLYLVMPAVADGITLQDLLRRDGPLLPTVAAQLIVQAAAALEAAHVAGLVHGDVNTSNLLVSGGSVYLIEFGAVAATDTVDARTDIYALTAVLYECLTGQPALVGEDGPPRPADVDPTIPAGFDAVIARGMAQEPDDRYQTARELSVAAHDALAAPAAGAESTDEEEFGRYRLFDKLGEGGMGAVYRAHDTALGRDVAVKVLKPQLAAEPGFQERFRREAYAAGRLANRNIIPIYETGEIDGRLYLVMPLVDGVDVQQVLRRDGPMSPEKAVRVVEQAAVALDAAHKSGLVHRDVKTSNLLIVGNDFVYLIDFGLVHEADATRLTMTNFALGTPAYMAPERFKAGTVADSRADVYSLACVLYECLTGRLPFTGGGVAAMTDAHRNEEPPKPSSVDPAIPTGFDEVIARGMAKDPEVRYQSAHQLAVEARWALTGDLDALASTHSAPATPPSPPTGRRTQVLIAALVVVIALVGVAVLLRLTNQFPFHSAHEPPQSVLPFTGLNGPQGVAVDAKGNVYVADSGNNRVLELSAGSTGQIVLPFAGLEHPAGIAVDDAGDVEVIEPTRNRVLELTAGTTTPAVLPFTDLAEPTGVAVNSRDPRNGRAVFVADSAHNRVLELVANSTGQTELPFTGLAGPSAVAVASDRVLFVIDRENERVLKLPWTARVDTVLPYAVGRPDFVAVDATDDLYVTDSRDNKVMRLVKSSNTAITLPFNGLNGPQGVAVDTAGNVYVADVGNNRVVKLPPSA